MENKNGAVDLVCVQQVLPRPGQTRKHGLRRIGGILAFGKRFISGKPQRVWLAISLTVVYALFLAHNFGIGDRLLGGDSTHKSVRLSNSFVVALQRTVYYALRSTRRDR